MTSRLFVANEISVGLGGSVLQGVIALAHVVLSAVLLTAATLAIAVMRGTGCRALHRRGALGDTCRRNNIAR